MKNLGAFTVALAIKKPAGSEDAQCDGSNGWEIWHRTLVLTGAAQVEVTGEPIGEARDLDGDGRPDLLIGFGESCLGEFSSRTVDSPNGQEPVSMARPQHGERGAFAVALDHGDKLDVVSAPKGGWEDVAWDKLGKAPAIKAGQIAPPGEFGAGIIAYYWFQLKTGKLVSVRTAKP